ncbi:MAG: YcxB family protein [Kangiellaceae bacterium]|nr:YcxB family protein [Kangiellaceae bacterium]
MKVVTTIRKWDLIRLNLSLLPKQRSTYVTFLIFAIFIFLYLSWKHCFPHSSNDWLAILAGAAGGSIGGILFSIIFSMLSVSLMSSEKNGILGRHEYQIDSRGIHEKTVANESLHLWDGVKKIMITKFFILFQINGYLFHVIPKQSFASIEQSELFIVQAINYWNTSHNR